MNFSNVRTMNLRARSRRGLTLIELIVVLVVLTALAGILLPQLPNLLTRSHIATNNTNFSEIAKAIMTYEQIRLETPTGWDSLIDEGGGLFAALPQDGGVPLGGQLSPLDLSGDPDVATTLEEAGITEVWPMDDASTEPTFNPYGAAAQPIASAVVAEVTDDTAKAGVFNAAPTDRLIVFGLGSRCSIVGAGVFEAPVAFADAESEQPALWYARFAVIYQVADANGPFDKARLRAVVALHGPGLDNAAFHLNEFYNLQGQGI